MQFTFSPTSWSLFPPSVFAKQDKLMNQTSPTKNHRVQTNKKRTRSWYKASTFLPTSKSFTTSSFRGSFHDFEFHDQPQKNPPKMAVWNTQKKIQIYVLFNKDPPLFTEICWRILTMRIITLWGTLDFADQSYRLLLSQLLAEASFNNFSQDASCTPEN